MNYKLGVILMSVFLFVACTNEKDDTIIIPENEETVTELILTIEPEYVLDSSFDRLSVFPAMQVFDDKGAFYDNLALNTIKDFTFEEGFRYKLKVRRYFTWKLGGKAYDYECLNVINKDYVGVNQKNSREVVMDVYPVILRVSSNFEIIMLRGEVVDTNEKLDMIMGEIKGVNFEDFRGNKYFNKLRMKASITPTDNMIYEKDFKVVNFQIKRRVRMMTVIDKHEMSEDSIIYVNDNDTIDNPSNQGSSYGDFEMQWIAGDKTIGKGILKAHFGQGYFTYSLVPGSDFAKYLLDLIYTGAYKEMKIVDSMTKGGKIQYSFIGNSADAYYFSMKWDYRLGVDLDGREYLVLPYMDEEKSTLLFDLKTQQWMGVLYIDKVQLYSITDAGSNLQKESIFTPPLKLVFNTLKKID